MTEEGAAASPGIRVPPPIVYLSGLLAGAALDRLVPLAPGYGSPFDVALGLAVTAVGLALDAWAAIAFKRAGTTVLPWARASFLVPGGPYRFTRNPMYLGMAVSYLGLSVAIGSWWALAVLPAVLLVITVYVIRREERHLEARFGDEYRAYRRRVRRWI